jgi:hypothetical protein
MTARRRSVVLSLAFLGAAALLARPPAAQAQPQRPLPSRGQTQPALSPDEVRNALEKLGGMSGDDPMLADLVRRVQQANPGLDPKRVEAITRDWMSDPAKRDVIERMVEQGRRTGKPPSPGELAKALAGVKGGGPAPEVPKGFRFPPVEKLPPLGTEQAGPQPRLGSAPRPPVSATDRPNATDRIRPNNPEPPELAGPDLIPGSRGRPDPSGPNVKLRAPESPGRGPANPLDLNGLTSPDTEAGRKQRAFQIASSMWEKNFGPLEETPAVRRAIIDLINGTADMKGPDGKNFWESLAQDAGDGSSLAEWLKGGPGGDWKMPSMDFGSTRLGRWWSGTGNVGGSSSGWSAPSSSGSSGSGFRSLGIPGLEGTWLPVVLLGAVLIGVLVWWRFWYLRDPALAAEDLPEGLGPWPVDPNAINSREDVVKAFEYLSVLICGMEARTWTHGTIAEALTALARTHGGTALMLARLYELARYAPLDEPLTPDELAEARRLVCGLAGVRHA